MGTLAALSRYQYNRALARFAKFQTGDPRHGVHDQIRGWLCTLTPHMARTAYMALRHAYGAQIDWTSIPRPSPRRNEARVQSSLLTADMRDRIRDSLQTPREWALVEMLWTLRRAEVARARWRDVDLGQGMIIVVGKGEKRSWTLLVESAQIALAEYFIASREPADEAPIFPGPSGRPIQPMTVTHTVRRILTRAGLYQLGRGPHSFRRTFATEFLRANPGDLRALQILMRHERVETTTLYTFLRPDDLRPRLDRVPL